MYQHLSVKEHRFVPTDPSALKPRHERRRMRTGTLDIPVTEVNLDKTMQVGQTFSWHTMDGQLYSDSTGPYYTTSEGNVLILEQDSDGLHFQATGGMEHEIERRLRLHESLTDITAALRGADDILDKAMDTYPGMRVLHDDIFPCLISYLCSAQMRIPRIKQMVNALCDTYGDPVEVDGQRFRQFPTVQQLAEASEDDLRDLSLGYRAKYVAETTDQLIRGEVDLDELQHMDYKDAHNEIKKLHGVGNKVADCVLLFGAGHLDAFPVDTWIRKAVKQYYPDKHDSDYHALSDNFRDHFGQHTGYAQEYLFHYVRNHLDD